MPDWERLGMPWGLFPEDGACTTTLRAQSVPGLNVRILDIKDAPPEGPTAGLQGYLAHKKPPSSRTLPQAFSQGPRVVSGGWVFSYQRGTPVVLRATNTFDTRVSNRMVEVSSFDHQF